MTPAKLHALAEAHIEAHRTSDEHSKHRKASANPAADLAALGAAF